MYENRRRIIAGACAIIVLAWTVFLVVRYSIHCYIVEPAQVMFQ